MDEAPSYSIVLIPGKKDPETTGDAVLFAGANDDISFRFACPEKACACKLVQDDVTTASRRCEDDVKMTSRYFR